MTSSWSRITATAVSEAPASSFWQTYLPNLLKHKDEMLEYIFVLFYLCISNFHSDYYSFFFYQKLHIITCAIIYKPSALCFVSQAQSLIDSTSGQDDIMRQSGSQRESRQFRRGKQRSEDPPEEEFGT